MILPSLPVDMVRAQHERLMVYHKALGLAERMEGIARSIPPTRRDLQDQIRRASSSIPFNIAEGASEFSSAEKIRFYRMARRSAGECMAILDLLARIELSAYSTEKEGLDEVIAMLTGMIKHHLIKT